MIRQLDLRGKRLSKSEINKVIPRAKLDVVAAMAVVEPILEQVRNGNESDLIALSKKFDGIAPKSIRVPKSELSKALKNLDPKVLESLQIAAQRIRKVHQDQIRDTKISEVEPGATVTEKWIPVDRVGLYVPGGRAVYPSSVLMNVIPAQIAKVPSIAVASPPQADNDGWPNATILATCELLGIDEVYAIGGAQAVALFAYGMNEVCEKADLVTGPGNIYVAAAKRALRGLIGIDSEAGPTEIAILADKSALAADVATDLISQAEHDVIAASVLVTDSLELATAVEAELKVRVAKTKHSERVATALSSQQSAIVIVDNIQQGLEVVNAYAAEHLEIQTINAKLDAAQIRNAGAVFIGRYAPVSLGDYAAGSNHVLPTGGCACHSSGLSVQTFLRGIHLIEYEKFAFNAIAETVVTLANAEDLPAHGEAITARFENE
ncbi:MAG: histidinol dehydrogenase [Candidatus Nanopelagicaceae bacterium]